MRWLLVLVGVLAAHRVASACEVPAPAGVAVKVDGLRATMRWPDGATRVVEAASCAELADAVALIAEMSAANQPKPARPAKPAAPIRPVAPPPDDVPAGDDTPSSDRAPAEPTPPAAEPAEAPRVEPVADAATARVDVPAPRADARIERSPDSPVALADGVSGLLGAASMHGSHGWQTSLALGARVRRDALSLELQVDATLPGSEALAVGSVEVWSIAATAAPCVHLGPFAACALASAGAVVGQGVDLASTRRAVTPLIALGGRLAMETALTPRFALRLRADVLGNVAASRFDVDGMTVWATDRFGAWFGADAILRFP